MLENVNKNENLDSDELLNQMVAEEIMKNDDIVKYAEGESLAALKSKYESLESDEDILAEDLRPRQKKGIFRKPRPIEYSGYFYEPIAADNPNELKTPEVSQDFSSQFDTAQSEYDRNQVSFRDISLETPAAPIEENKIEQEPPAVSTDNEKPQQASVHKEIPDNHSGKDDSEAEFTQSYISDDHSEKFDMPKPQSIPNPSREFSSSLNRGYNTNTKVVFYDKNTENASDSNADQEISSLFSSEAEATQHSRRFNPFKRFRHRK